MMPNRQRISNRSKRMKERYTNRRIPTVEGGHIKGENPAPGALPTTSIMINRLKNRPIPPAQPQTPKPKKYNTIITLNGMVYTNDSFSIVTRGLVNGLIQNGLKVAIDAWPDGNRNLPIEPDVRKAVRCSSDNKIGIRISHPNSFQVLEHYDYKIGKGYFETNLFPNKPGHDWVSACNKYCDQLWVSSTFNKEVCEKSGAENVYVVHDGFDPNIYSPNGDKYNLGIPEETFVFLTIGNSQKRKGTDLLFQAFTKEFQEKENVALVYKSYAPWAWGAGKYAHNGWSYKPELVEKYNIDYVGHPKIYHIGDIDEWLDPNDQKWKPILTNSSIPYNKIGSLYRSADCFVLPTYGEGAGICNLEAMACGLPVITTNWSAHLDYCNNKNSYLIEAERLEPAFEGDDWQGEWAVPSLDQLKFYMRYVFERPEMVKYKADQALKDAQQFTWKNCAKEAIERLIIGFPDIFTDIDFEVLNL